MFPALNKIRTTDIDDMSETFCRVDNEIVVFDHLKLTELLSSSRFIENTFVDCLDSANVEYAEIYIWDGIVDKFRKHKTV